MRTPLSFLALALLLLVFLTAALHAQIAAPAPTTPADAGVGRLVIVDPETRTEGKGLAIASYTADIEIHGRLAQTTVTQVFTNDGDSQLEGTFTFTLPAGASMSRFAMTVGDQLVEGEIVERQRGRAIYEDIVRSMKDPALLEMTQGNLFKARVFPIPAHGDKTIVLAFTQELPSVDGGIVYTLPLTSEAFTSHHVGKVAIQFSAETAGGYRDFKHTFDGRTPVPPQPRLDLSWTIAGAPDRDLVFTLVPQQADSDALDVAPAPPGESEAYLGYRTRLAAQLPAAPPFAGDRRIVFLVDTSASVTADELATAIELLQGMLGQLGARDHAAVIAFDRQPELLLRSESAGAPSPAHLAALAQRLRDRGALGGSDLGAALAAAGQLLATNPGVPNVHDVIVLLGDGMATMGVTAPELLLAAVQATDAQLLPVAVGSQHDRALLQEAARLGGGVLTVAIPGAGLVTPALGRSGLAGLPERVLALAAPGALVTGLQATVQAADGSKQVRNLANAVPGAEIQLTARVPGDPAAAAVSLRGQLAGQSFHTEALAGATPATSNPFLPRHWASAEIEQLLVKAQSPEIKAQVIALSERHRVMTPYTVFLVLESEEAFRQHQIARRPRRDAPQGARAARDGRTDGAPPEADSEAAEGGGEPELRRAMAEDHNESATEEEHLAAGGESMELGLAGDDAPADSDEEDGATWDEEPTTGAAAPAESAPAQRPQAPAAEEPLSPAPTPMPDGDRGEELKKLAEGLAARVQPIDPSALPDLAITFAPGGDATLQPASATGEEAISQAIAAVDAAPRSRAARKQLGLLLLGARDDARAARWSRDWITIDPGNLTPYLHLGKALARSSADPSQQDDALRAFTSLVDVRPGEAESHRVLGRLLTNYGLFEEARAQFTKAMEDRPDDPSGLQDLAQLAVATGDFARAADLFATLAERDWPESFGPVRDLARQQLGMLALRLEGRARAAGDGAAAEGWAARRTKAGSDHFKPRDVKVLINWDTAGTDVDLWVTGPDGVKCFYSNKTTPMGGNLYADITTGFGPEIYYLDRAAYGDYEVKVHYYSAGEADDSHVRALVVLFEGTARQQIHEVDLTLHAGGDEAVVARFSLAAGK